MKNFLVQTEEKVSVNYWVYAENEVEAKKVVSEWEYDNCEIDEFLDEEIFFTNITEIK